MAEQSSPRSGWAALKRFVMWVFALALVAAVLYLLSERNQRFFAVEQHGSELWVMKGRAFPVGFELYQPEDKLLAQTYAPLVMQGDAPGGVILSRFEDRDALDRALFKTLKTWIEARLETEEPERLAQALKLVRRAELLRGLEDEQRHQLKDLQTKIAWFEGRARLDDAATALTEAVNRLREASESRGRYARDAAELHGRVSAMSEQLVRAVRMPLSSERMAAAGEPAAEPAPASADTAKVPPAGAAAEAVAPPPAEAAPKVEPRP